MKLIRTNSFGLKNLYRQAFNKVYSAGIESFFKHFNTDPNASGVAHYPQPLTTGTISNITLNPFGQNTINEYITYDDALTPDDALSEGNNIDLAYRKVRSFGIKTPMTYVGWGYDIYGYPAPNYNDTWAASGHYGDPSLSNIEHFPRYDPENDIIEQTVYGTDVNVKDFKAGPLDLRWDQIRGVWTMNYGLYAAVIEKVYNSGSLISDFNTPVWGHTLTYDAHVYDGPYSGIRVTGVYNQIPQPLPNTYKVLPLNTGSSCLIVNVPGRNTLPTFGLYGWPKPFATGCSATGSAVIEEFLDYLSLNPLGVEHGGIGTNNFAPYEILMGNTTGTLSKGTITNSDYINVQFTGTTIHIDVASGRVVTKDVVEDSAEGDVLQYTSLGFRNTGNPKQRTLTITGSLTLGDGGHSGISTYFINTSLNPVSIYINLLNASGNQGREIILKDIGGAADTKAIWMYTNPTSQKIDGGYSGKINRPYGYVKLISDNNNWYTIGAYAAPTGSPAEGSENTWVYGGAGLFED